LFLLVLWAQRVCLLGDLIVSVIGGMFSWIIANPKAAITKSNATVLYLMVSI